MEELDLSDLLVTEVPVVGPDKKNYVMRSASTDATVKYRNASAKAGKWDQVGDEQKFKVVGFENIADAEPLLVSLCLCETNGNRKGEVLLKRDGTPVYVAESLIRGWPGPALDKLFDLAHKLSPWLKSKEDPEAPKDKPNDGADSSS